MRVILLHPKVMEDEEINGLLTKLREVAGPVHTYTSGRDVYAAVADRMGKGGTGWANFTASVAQDYDVYVVPGNTENPTVAQGTATILTLAFRSGKIINLWDPYPNHWWPVGGCVLGKPQGGRATYNLLPKGSPTIAAAAVP